MNSSQAIVIGASAGGVAALLELASALLKELRAVIGMVLHVGSRHSMLPELLTARGGMPAILHPADGQPLAPGTIYVAPPDRHMLFTADRVWLNRGARENHARPAIDPLFRSAALGWRERAIGVVLTGDLDDGTARLAAIKQCGGTAIVQDPATAGAAQHAGQGAAERGRGPLPALGRDRAHAGAPGGGPPAANAAAPPTPLTLTREHDIFFGKRTMENLSAIGRPSSLTCPDCGGGLWEIGDSKPLRYRCHTGHAFSARSLENAQVELAEHALWSSVRALQEREILLRRLATVAQATGDLAQAQAGQREANRVRSQADMLSRLVEGELNGG